MHLPDAPAPWAPPKPPHEVNVTCGEFVKVSEAAYRKLLFVMNLALLPIVQLLYASDSRSVPGMSSFSAGPIRAFLSREMVVQVAVTRR